METTQTRFADELDWIVTLEDDGPVPGRITASLTAPGQDSYDDASEALRVLDQALVARFGRPLAHCQAGNWDAAEGALEMIWYGTEADLASSGDDLVGTP